LLAEVQQVRCVMSFLGTFGRFPMRKTPQPQLSLFFVVNIPSSGQCDVVGRQDKHMQQQQQQEAEPAIAIRQDGKKQNRSL